MNTTASELSAYIDVFHSTLEATAARYLPTGLPGSLFNLSFLPSKIRGYLSTQFGAAFEYVGSGSGIEVVSHSRRIEALFLDYPTHYERQFARRGPVFNLTDDAREVTIEGISVADGLPFRLCATNNHLVLIDCHFGAPGWSRDVVAAELYGNRSASFWSPQMAVTRAKDVVLAAQFDVYKASSHHLPLAEYANTKKQKGVLVLGDYSGEGMRRLEAICRVVRELGYEPFLAKDVPEIFATDLQQKVSILGGLSRFVLIDDSSCSGHLVEIQTAQQSRWVTVLLHSEGRRSSFMTSGLAITSKVIGEQDYDHELPNEGVKRAITWAESQLEVLETRYQKAYPWRDACFGRPTPSGPAM